MASEILLLLLFGDFLDVTVCSSVVDNGNCKTDADGIMSLPCRRMEMESRRLLFVLYDVKHTTVWADNIAAATTDARMYGRCSGSNIIVAVMAD